MARSIPFLLAMLVMGCGPKHAPPGGGGGGSGGGGGDGSASGDGAGTGKVVEVKPAPLSRAECEQMIDHVLEIGMAQQRAQKSADYVPTPEQVAKVRERLVADQLSACLAWPRPQWECVMASKTIETLYACAEEPAPAGDAKPSS